MISFSPGRFGPAGVGLTLLVLLVITLRRARSRGGLRFSGLALVREAAATVRLRAGYLERLIRGTVVVLLLLALMRPRHGQSIEELLSPGVDIVITLDLSGSMQAEDMGGRSRIAAAKDVVTQFVRGRVHDRIGLVVFAGKSFTQCPLTMDYGLLERLVEQLDVGLIKHDGTAIGMGLTTALNRLKNSEAKSRVIVLVTDGRSNAGTVDPATAADLAKSMGIKIYTVGVASKGPAPIPVQDPFTGAKRYTYIQEDLNEESLLQIARSTGGIFRRAADAQSLSEIFAEISSLEKTTVKVREYHLHRELFLWLVIPALALLATQMLLTRTIWRRIP